MGFTFVYSDNPKLNDLDKQSNSIFYKSSAFYNNFVKKFSQDKVFKEIEEVFYCFDGVIINLTELKKKYCVEDVNSLFGKLYKNYGIEFIKELRGNFSGVIYDKSSEEYYVFTNHAGNKYVYYFHDKNSGTFIASNKIKEITSLMRKLGYEPSVCKDAAYFLLTFGYMIMDLTLVNDVKKVNPGTYIKVKDKKIQEVEYFAINNSDINNDSEEKAMKEMYERFSHAIKSSFNKDKENNYRHLSFLSGGLDSRLISISASEFGYDDITTLTFSENYSLDEQIARKIATDFKFYNIFNSLNNGRYMKNIEKCVELNSGQIIYLGASHLISTLDSINLDNFGMIHNGNMADIMHGDYIDAPEHRKPQMKNWAYSTKLLNKVSHYQNIIEEKYGNEELFATFNRGINGIYNGSVSAHDFTETIEDYTHADIVEYCFKMPPSYKYRERVFLMMIEKYFPKAANYKWQKWNAKPNRFNYHFIKTVFGKGYLTIIDSFDKLVKGKSRLNMNPFDYWYKNNPEIKQYLDNYYKENIDLIDDLELKKDCEDLFVNGNVVEKTQVMTLLEFYKNILN